MVAAARLPESLVPGDDGRGPVRRYLDAGGKIVWIGVPPLLARVDPETGRLGSLLDIDWEAPGRLLDVDHGQAIFDPYGAWPTAAGRRWGLHDRIVGAWAATPDDELTVLAEDENGLALAWVRNYGGPPGTGFARLPLGARGFPSPHTVHVVAEYRPPAAAASGR